jgi:hypothetical protein
VSISFISDVDASFVTPDALALSADLQERISQRSSAELDGTSSANTTAAAATGATPAPSGVVATGDVPDGLALSYQEKLLGTDSRPSTAGALDPSSTASSSSAVASAGSSSSVDQSATTATTTAPFFSPRTNAADTAASTPSSGRISRKKSSTPPALDGDKATAAATSTAAPPVADPALLAWQRKYALDQRVQSLIDLLWLDPHSEEGKARAKFLRAFPGLEAKPEALLAATRKFLDSFRTYMERKRIDVLRKRIVGDPAAAANASPDMDQLSLAEFESSFHARVERSAEVAVLLPILPRLHASLATIPPERGGTRDADALVARQCALLRSKWSQAEFGIPLRHHSPSTWSAASRELRQIELFDLPCDKLEVLLGTAKAIYQTFKIESQAKLMKQKAEEAAAVNGAVSSAAVSSSSSLFLAGDEFFPIFTFVLAHTPLRVGIVSLKHALWGLADPAALQGEAGYYLTVFDAAIEFVRTADPNTPVDLTAKPNRRAATTNKAGPK